MRWQICGKGFLGSFAHEFLYHRFGYQTSFSDAHFQYCDGNVEIESLNSDVVLNVSGPSSVEESINKPNYYLATPVKQVKFHLEHLSQLESPPHYIFISSAAVYGNCSNYLPDENARPAPLSPYAEGKLKAERFLESIATSYKGGVTILRPTSIFSENLKSRVMWRIKEGVARGFDFELFGDGSESRDFLHAEDFFQILNSTVVHGNRLKKLDIYNVGSGTSITMSYLLKIALENSRNSKLTQTVKFNNLIRPGDPHSIRVSIEKVQKNLSIEITDTELKIARYFSS